MSRRSRTALELLETRRLMTSIHPIGVNFNDEAKFDSQFDTAVAQSKALGITAARVWVGFDSYDQRPNAWDAVPVYSNDNPAWNQTGGSPASAMATAFKLAHAGFSVMIITNPNGGLTPGSPQQVKGFIRHLMDATETTDSTQTLADVVDYWEIGNETDSGTYWAPSAVNKTAGLISYVDQFLIPAAEELHSNIIPETVVSGGVSWSPADLKTILDELAAKNAIGDIDYAGFHPYGNFDPSNPSAGNQVLDRTLLAKQYASVYGKQLIASEWNVRGFSNTGGDNAKWAAAVDYEYRNVILPNYAEAYYFALVNNWAGRGGSISARPAGLLSHDTTLAVTPNSPASDLAAYYNTPLKAADYFYSTVMSWTAPSTPTGSDTPSDPATPTDDTTTTDPTTPSDPTPVDPTPVVPTPPAPTGPATISGFLWNDGNGDGLVGDAETRTGSRVVFLDANRNGKLDAGELQVTSDANGNYTFTGLAAGTYYVSRVFPTGYHLSNATTSYITVVVTAGQVVSAANVGTTDKKAAPVTPVAPTTPTVPTVPVTPVTPVVPPATPTVPDSTPTIPSTPVVTPTTPTVPVPPTVPTVPSTPTSTGTATISGQIFARTSAQQKALLATGLMAYIDANHNGKLDAGEVTAAVNATTGTYSFTKLFAGTYTIGLATAAGWSVYTPGSKTFVINLTTGRVKTGQNFVVQKA